MQVQPYLNFNGACEEAIEFYKTAVGAKVSMLMRFKDAPPGAMPQGKPELGNLVMHAHLIIGDSSVLMSDGRCQGERKFDGVALSISVESDAEAVRVFNALGQGGQVFMPMSKTFFSSNFGMLNDRFGVQWMVIVQN